MNHLYLGIDLGGSHISMQLMDKSGQVRDCLIRRGLSGHISAEELLVIVEKMVQSQVVMENIKLIESAKLMAVGFAAPGPLDPEKGILLSPPNFPNIFNLEIVASLRERMGLPVFLLNDADAAVLGEAWLGAAKGFRNVVMLTLGTGVGSGIITDGKLQRGRGMGGEWGHVPIYSAEARPCSCGRFHCLESFCGTLGLAQTYCQVFDKALDSSEISKISIEMDRNWRNDGKWHSVFEYYCWNLKEGLINIAHVHHPECIVLGGGIASPAIVNKVTEFLQMDSISYKLGSLLAGMEIKLAQLNNPGIIGAAKHAMNCTESFIAGWGSQR